MTLEKVDIQPTIENILDSSEHMIKKTRSLCPECLKILRATIFERDEKVWIKKTCPDHGEIVELYWGDYSMYKKAATTEYVGHGITNPTTAVEKGCPFDCGLCKQHKSHTALANVVLTNRCDISCWYCFFYAKKGDHIYEPSLDQLRSMFQNLKKQTPIAPNCIQLTGGEPALRDDVFEIVKMAREEGFDHIQFNTNGIRLANDPTFASNLLKSGANVIYLSFDGVTSKTNPKNHWEIPQAIENCRNGGPGIVLVPTVIKGKNDHELGDILRFAFNHVDIVRAVNFQPVSLVGRMPRRERELHRITIPDVVKRIEDQTNGQIGREAFYTIPSVVEVSHLVEAITGRPTYEFSNHYVCGMATYIFKEGDRMIPITDFFDVDGFFELCTNTAMKMKGQKLSKWAKFKFLWRLKSLVDSKRQPQDLSIRQLLWQIFHNGNYHGLRAFHHNALFIGIMHFQDLYNYDIERVERCNIHYAMPDGTIVPFCAFNVIPNHYRDKIQDEFSIPPKEWEQIHNRRLKDDKYLRHRNKS